MPFIVCYPFLYINPSKVIEFALDIVFLLILSTGFRVFTLVDVLTFGGLTFLGFFGFVVVFGCVVAFTLGPKPFRCLYPDPLQLSKFPS
jgi:hypothetical protein